MVANLFYDALSLNYDKKTTDILAINAIGRSLRAILRLCAQKAQYRARATSDRVPVSAAPLELLLLLEQTIGGGTFQGGGAIDRRRTNQRDRRRRASQLGAAVPPPRHFVGVRAILFH